MEVGQPENAIPYCRRALEVRPEDAGLRANLALAILFSGKPTEAEGEAKEALRRDPHDQITSQLVRIIDEVLRGERPCPRHVQDLSNRSSQPYNSKPNRRP